MAVSESGHPPATISKSQNIPAANTADDSEFEYEYDENETEDFYFTLDVGTDQSHIGSKPDISTRSSKKTKAKPAVQNIDKLQVLDLHSDNPLIKLGDSFYSCRWSTDLGMQLYVAKPGVAENPLRRGHVLDVLAISRSRLTGTPVTLHRRRPEAQTTSIGSSTTNAIVLDDDEDSVSEDNAPDNSATLQHPSVNKNIARLTTVRQNARDPHAKAQASFLERLAIIKHRKGETDAIPVHGVEELPGRNHGTGGTPDITTNGKRKSVSGEVLDGPESSDLSRKRRLSMTQDTTTFAGERGKPGVRESNSTTDNDHRTSTAIDSRTMAQSAFGDEHSQINDHAPGAELGDASQVSVVQPQEQP